LSLAWFAAEEEIDFVIQAVGKLVFPALFALNVAQLDTEFILFPSALICSADLIHFLAPSEFGSKNLLTPKNVPIFHSE
jgi:hypothetical protein